MPRPPHDLTLDELAQRLGVSRATVIRMRADGRLPPPARRYQRTIVAGEVVEVLRADPGKKGPRIPWRVWARVLATLPNATPATLDTELRGALRAAARVGYTGSSKVEVIR